MVSGVCWVGKVDGAEGDIGAGLDVRGEAENNNSHINNVSQNQVETRASVWKIANWKLSMKTAQSHTLILI